MIIKVTKDTVKIVEEDYILNKGEYNVNKCYFEFSDDYTDDLVKKAIFEHGDVKIEMVIANNQCDIPYEVLNFDTFEVRVYAYEVDGDDLVLRYSPTYTNAYLREGSYDADATAGEKITPSQYEQYEQALNDGLVEVNSKLDDVDTAITEANNLDADVTKVATKSILSITKKDGSIQSVDIFDGVDGAKGIDGKDAKINGVNTLTMQAGDNITLNQQGSTLTISSTGGSGGTSDYTDLTNKPQINGVTLSGNKTTSQLGINIPVVPTNVSAFTNDVGYTTNTGTITSVKMNGSTISSSGEADLGTVITQHQDISGKLDTSKVKNANSTTAGDVYDVRYINSLIGDINTVLATLTTVSNGGGN